MLDATLNQEAQLQLLGLCHHGMFPWGPLTAMDLHFTQNPVKNAQVVLVCFIFTDFGQRTLGNK